MRSITTIEIKIKVPSLDVDEQQVLWDKARTAAQEIAESHQDGAVEQCSMSEEPRVHVS